MSDTPRFYTSMSAWPLDVRRYAYQRCWDRQREAQGGVMGGQWKDGGDDAVVEWMYRGRDGVRAMATAAEIWPTLCADAQRWADQERAKAQRTEER